MQKYPALHPSEADFVEIRRRNALYVDKTASVAALLATDDTGPRGGERGLTHRYQLLLRPRRFGKTMLINTLEAWFQELPPDPARPDGGGRDLLDVPEGWAQPDWLWEGLAAPPRAGEHGWHPVIRLDMSRVAPETPHGMHRALQASLTQVFREWGERTGKWKVRDDVEWDRALPPPQMLEDLIVRLGDFYKRRPVLLVDEYDAPLVRWLGGDVDTKPAEDALRALYRVFKDDAGKLYGGVVTGITRLAKPALFSAANNFLDSSDDERLTAICGFTEPEVETALAPHLDELCGPRFGFDRAAVLDQWRDMYNGYRFAADVTDARVYNPFTLINAVDDVLSDPDVRRTALKGEWPSAWSATAHPGPVVRLAAELRDALPHGGRPDTDAEGPDSLRHPDFVRLMYDTGYYTWHGGRRNDEPFLHFPNREVARSWLLDSMGGERGPVPDAARLTDEIHACLRRGDIPGFARRLEAFHSGLAYHNLDSEACCRAVLQTLCRLGSDDVQAEKATWGGRSDIEVDIGDHIYVMEVKHGKEASTAEAMKQIRNRPYGRQHLPGDRQAWAVALAFIRDPDAEPRTRLECSHRDLRTLLADGREPHPRPGTVV